MSEKTIRSGISSGFNLASTAASRMSSSAAAKLVLPPHGARRAATAFWEMPASGSSRTHVGQDSKVMKRCAKAGAASSDVRIPSAMATCMGTPLIDPETSTRGTSLPRLTTGLRAADSPVAAACAAAAFARLPCTLARSVFHWASNTSSSSVLTLPDSTDTSLATISCGCRAAPFRFFPLDWRVFRREARAATRSSSSGKRFPVSS
mmetsp:Transcript_14870/g.43697  ORF Transcript_14870/g.43697 Transcript_14870/m.43697 type:complete len:206 (-) Transcript_14870:175-792(-)